MKRFYQMTKQQQQELMWFCQRMDELQEVIDGRMDPRALIQKIKDEYDAADAVYLNQAATAFRDYAVAAGNTLRGRVCLLVQRSRGLTKPYPLLGWSSDHALPDEVTGKLHIFRLVQNRGNPNKKLKRPYAE